MLRHPLFRIMSILRGDYPKRARAKTKSTKTSLHSYERKSHFRPEGQVYGVDAISWCYDWVRERCCWGGINHRASLFKIRGCFGVLTYLLLGDRWSERIKWNRKEELSNAHSDHLVGVFFWVYVAKAVNDLVVRKLDWISWTVFYLLRKLIRW